SHSLGVREGISLTRNLNNLGTLAPGLSTGLITVQSYQQAAAASLAIDISGTTVDTQYDRLAVSGAAQLAGKLTVAFLGSYAPSAGDSFTVLSAGSISGSFNSMDLPTVKQGQFWRLTQSATSVVLAIAGGDYDHNNAVNAADLVVWKNS